MGVVCVRNILGQKWWDSWLIEPEINDSYKSYMAIGNKTLS